MLANFIAKIKPPASTKITAEVGGVGNRIVKNDVCPGGNARRCKRCLNAKAPKGAAREAVVLSRRAKECGGRLKFAGQVDQAFRPSCHNWGSETQNAWRMHPTRPIIRAAKENATTFLRDFSRCSKIC
jgi:hypothetical protein